jgi:hypothetical protein
VEAFLFAAPFAAGLSWNGADFLARLEPALVVRRLGHLLIAVAIKP